MTLGAFTSSYSLLIAAVCCLLSAVCCLLSAVCCLLSATSLRAVPPQAPALFSNTETQPTNNQNDWLLATGYWLLATGYWLLASTILKPLLAGAGLEHSESLPPSGAVVGMQAPCCLSSALVVCPGDKPPNEFKVRPTTGSDKGTGAQRRQASAPAPPPPVRAAARKPLTLKPTHLTN